MGGRTARDDEIETWVNDGWVLLDGLVDTDDIDRAYDDLFLLFPRPEKFHANPKKYWPAGKTDADLRRGYPELPEAGPAFRPEQHRWGREFPFYGNGELNKLSVHPSIVDFAERALATTDIRMYQVQCSAKYTGDANYEQPLHTDRNHSWLPARSGPPFWHVEMFLYLSDVSPGTAPTHFVSRRDAEGRSVNVPLIGNDDPEMYAREKGAPGVRGSLVAYRNETFHRAVNLTEPGGSRFLMNVSYKAASVDWIGYHSLQSRASHPGWAEMVAWMTPRQLELFGFPPPGHPVWDDDLLAATQEKYPDLDLTPWREALAG
jgi:hypothetical protein